MVGPFNQYCGHQSGGAAASYWPMQNHGHHQQHPSYYNNSTNSFDDYDEADYMYSSSSSSSSPYSSVDCTLSLGTPSTRFTNDNTKTTPRRNSVSSFCWDLLHPKHSSGSSAKAASRGNNHSGAGDSGGSDPLFVRRCANCDTTSTPLWRNGPRGPKSLCNACGIRYKKEERRAAAATNIAAANNGAASGMMDPHNGYYNGSWAHQYSQATPQKMQCFGGQNEFRFIEDDHGSADSGIQFLSWLTHDRPSGLVHDFTR